MKHIALSLNVMGLIGALYATYAFWPSGNILTVNDYIFPAFLCLFCLIFLVGIIFFMKKNSQIDIHKGMYGLNAIILFFFLITCYFARQFTIRNTITSPLHTQSIIYKVDAESLEAPRLIYYRYTFKGKTYRGNFYDEEKKYQIGDSLSIKISADKPWKNVVLGAFARKGTRTE